MSGTISMETEHALHVAMQLEQNARKFEQLIDELTKSFKQLEVSWQGGSARDLFINETTDLGRWAEILNRELVELQFRLVKEIKEWEMAASHLSQGASSGGVRVATALRAGIGEGEVLGVAISAAVINSKNYQKMSWSDRFTEEASLASRIAAAEEELATMLTPEERANAAKNLDEQIAIWTVKKGELEKQLKNPLNSLPGNLQGDRAIDIYKAEFKRCEDQIASLQERKALLLDDQYWKDKQLQLENNIGQLKAQQAELQKIIQRGISSNGPTRGIQLAGCAKFVAEKRNVSDFMIPGQSDAHQWDENARQAGYDVGTRPVPGSIMVLEQNNSVMSGLSDAGHVVYIEKVTPVEGGYKITYSEASTPRIEGTNKWDGTYRYVNPRTSTSILKVPATGVSFIYEKP